MLCLIFFIVGAFMCERAPNHYGPLYTIFRIGGLVTAGVALFSWIGINFSLGLNPSQTNEQTTTEYPCAMTEGGELMISMPNDEISFLNDLDGFTYQVDESLNHLVYRKTEVITTAEPTDTFERIALGIVCLDAESVTEITSEVLIGPKAMLGDVQNWFKPHEKADSPTENSLSFSSLAAPLFYLLSLLFFIVYASLFLASKRPEEFQIPGLLVGDSEDGPEDGFENDNGLDNGSEK